MNPNQNRRKKAQAGSAASPPGVRPGMRMATVIVVVVSVFAAVLYLRKGGSPAAPPEDQAAASVSRQPTASDLVSAKPSGVQEQPNSAALPPVQEVVVATNTTVTRTPLSASEPADPSWAGAASSLAEPTPQARQLVNSLVHSLQPGSALTEEKAIAWKENLRQLTQQGTAAVPAILEFLGRNTDLTFSLGGSQVLGYDSARSAMIDVLAQIGGPAGLAATLQTLQNTGDPREIALLAKNLEAMAPEQYRQQALQAAREVLTMAFNDQLPADTDVAPLFEVLQRYGGAEVIADFEQAMNRWKYYAVQSIAQLPDGIGVPILISMTEDGPDGTPKPDRQIALQMLAQLATTHPEARAALVAQAGANRISPSIWPYLAPLLEGSQMQLEQAVLYAEIAVPKDARRSTSHISYGNQNFYYAPPGGVLTVEQVNLQLGFVDELRGVTSDPAAVRVLQDARVKLEEQLAKLTAA